MELFWYIIASLGAGIGTGFAGLSAASVMVPALSGIPLVVQAFRCLGRLICYLIPCVVLLLPIRFLTPVPSFVFRKMLHIFAISCFLVMLLSAESWQAAAVTSLVIAVILYPLLSALENESWYGKLFVQKSPGEIKRSLLMLFFMFAAVITLGWGVFNKLAAASASILMWGLGDAAAALIGIPFGKHKIHLPVTDGKKSWEGSGAMFLTAFLAGSCLLWMHFGYPAETAFVSAGIMAAAGAAVELFSASEWDTVTVPAVLLVLSLLLL